MKTIIDKRLLKRIRRDFPIELFYQSDGEGVYVLAVTHDINTMGAYVKILGQSNIDIGQELDVIISVPKDPDKIFPHYEIRARAKVIRVEDISKKDELQVHKSSRITSNKGVAIRFLEDLHMMPGVDV